MDRVKVDCQECGKEEFRVEIDAGGCVGVECIGCRTRYCLGQAWTWATISEGHGQDANGNTAMESAGDVASDLVSTAEAIAMREGSCSADVRDVAARRSTAKVRLQESTPSVVITVGSDGREQKQAAFDRNVYQREYMRKRRAKLRSNT